MAEITKVGAPSEASRLLPANCRVSELLAGEAIGAMDACYVKASDGYIYKATGAAANAAARVRGFSAKSASLGQPVTLIFSSTTGYGINLTPGTDLFLSGTVAGGLADAASTGGTAPIAFVVDASRIYLLPPR